MRPKLIRPVDSLLDGTLQPQVYRHKQKQGVKGADEGFAEAV